MTRREFSTFAMALRTYYPKDNLFETDQSMELWYRELSDISNEVAEAVLRQWVQTNRWCPTIADIRELASMITQPEIVNWGEAWEKVKKTIRRYTAYRAKEALESLDPLTRKCVVQLGYQDLCASTNPMQDRANFRMIYETLAKRERNKRQTSPMLQQAIEKMQLKKGNDFLLKETHEQQITRTENALHELSTSAAT